MGNNNIFVLIPAYNEEKSIGLAVRSALKNREIKGCVVVDDGSKDDTGVKARNAGAQVITMDRNVGSAAATFAGLRCVVKKSLDAIVIMDGDGQHDPKHIPDIIEEVARGADCVIASRYINPSKSVTTISRRIGTKCISLWISFWYGIRIFDATSGYRALNKRVLQQLSRFYPLRFSEPEIILDLLEKGFIIREVPCQMKPRRFGRSSISTLKAMQLMVYIFLKIMWRGFRRRFNTELA